MNKQVNNIIKLYERIIEKKITKWMKQVFYNDIQILIYDFGYQKHNDKNLKTCLLVLDNVANNKV